ncbi:MAG TPA: HAD-IA family hydrolase [Candidatus Saccharimonadia bacterium]
MIKAIIFDYYGVLTTDRYFTWLRRNPEVARRHTAAIEALSREQDAGLDADTFFSRLADIAHESAASVRDEFNIHGVEHEALLEYIASLRQLGLKTAILSNSTAAGLQAEVERHHLAGVFDVILSSGEAGVIKPDPAIFKLVLNRLAAEAHEAVFVDDRDYNVRGAAAAGLTALEYDGLAGLRRELERLGIKAG